jgi:hypothetical protein
MDDLGHRLLRRDAVMARIGQHHVERVAQDIDGRAGIAVGDQIHTAGGQARIVGLDDIHVGIVGHDAAQHLVAQPQAELEVVRVYRASRNLTVHLEDRVPHRKAMRLIDRKRLRRVGKVIGEEKPRPGVAGFRIGGHPPPSVF